MISDHALATSGVGTQSRFLMNGLITTGKYSFRQFGAAIQHKDYNTVSPHPDLVIKPIDGFGTPELLRIAIATEKPDALILFNDPRFFHHVFEISDEIHQMCPIAYWTIWDQCKFKPMFNKLMYDSIDLLNCINYPTYDFLANDLYKDKPHKVNFIPHAVPESIYFERPKEEVTKIKKKMLPNFPEDTFVVGWVNRNAKRKMPGDLLVSWKMFLDELQKKHSHKNAVLIMHTDPLDNEGPNLHYIADENLNIKSNVIFSKDKIEFNDMSSLYNVCDTVINRSNAEGFGLSTLEAMYCGKPIIALKTGGLERQVVDHTDGSENGIALPVELQTLSGNQLVPGIYEDFVSHKTTADALMKMYELGEDGRRELGQKAMKYAKKEFSMERMISSWDKSLEDLIKNWRSRLERYTVKTY